MPEHRGPDLQEDRDLPKFDYVSFMEKFVDVNSPHPAAVTATPSSSSSRNSMALNPRDIAGIGAATAGASATNRNSAALSPRDIAGFGATAPGRTSSAAPSPREGAFVHGLGGGANGLF